MAPICEELAQRLFDRRRSLCARWWPAQAAARADACGFGLRSLRGARTVTSMGATSNNRWSARAVSFGEARCVSMIWIKCLRSAPQRPRDAQLHR